MATTIPVQDVTRQRLQRLRDDLGASSYDEVIQRLLTTASPSPPSLLGAYRRLKPFRKEDRAGFHDL
ncbi:MAG TPA: hypothetical protein VJ397_01895 [Thermoplasmata archaeon]|nr:hypothetical protein [Thermoplasmata archaeon]